MGSGNLIHKFPLHATTLYSGEWKLNPKVSTPCVHYADSGMICNTHYNMIDKIANAQSK